MKKAVSIFLVLTILMASIWGASAEEFTIHSGTTFNMTIDEVIEAEKTAGFSPKRESGGSKETFYFCKGKHSDEYVYVKGQIAGQQDSRIIYHFDNETGILNAAVYTFYYSGTKVYQTLRNTLINKYGEPFDFSTINVWLKYLKPDALNVLMYASCYANVTYYNGDSWLVPQDNGDYVLIISICARINGAGWEDCSYIGYQYYSKSEVESALDNEKKDLNQINDDL